jgi:hypothetical protein
MAISSRVSEIVIPCLLFGEIRAILGNQDTLPIRVMIGVEPLQDALTTADLWAAIVIALMSHATAELALDERGCSALRDVLQVSMLAVDDEFVEVSSSVPVVVNKMRLPSVAVIPPVSGG